MRPLPIGCAVLLAGSGLCAEVGPGQALPAARARPGEQLRYSASLGPLADAAVLVLEAQEPAASGGSDLRLVASVEPGELVATFYSFSYRHISAVVPGGMRPLSGSRQIREAGDQWFFTLSYDRARQRVELARSAGGEPYAADPIETDTQDLLTALYHLRELAPDRPAEFTVYESRRLYRVSVSRATEEDLPTAAGSVEAWHRVVRVDPAGGQLADPTVHVWLSREEHRAPLRFTASLTAGALVLELAQRKVSPGK